MMQLSDCNKAIGFTQLIKNKSFQLNAAKVIAVLYLRLYLFVRVSKESLEAHNAFGIGAQITSPNP